jgi:hypothetical protein
LLAVPANVSTTAAVLSPAKLARYNKAKTSAAPVEIVTLAEAKAAEKAPSTAKKHGFCC